MIPSADSKHTEEALALLTDMFKDKPVIAGIIRSIADEIQRLEDSTWQLINGLMLANAVGDVLDKYGSIVLVPRTGMTDSEYKIAILLKIRVLRSQGLAEDVIQSTSIVLASFVYAEYAPAGWTVTSFDVSHADILLRLLGKAKAAGTRGNFIFTSWAPGNDIIWGSTVGTVTAAKGFGDKISGIQRNMMVSSQEFTR